MFLFMDEILQLEDVDAQLPKPEFHDLFILLYTSGSTGVPKGCMLEYGNITAFCQCLRNYYHIALIQKQRHMHPLVLMHA